MPAEIRQFLIGSDNFGVLLHDSVTGATASIDAGEEAPIVDMLARTGWRLTDILVTHHHGDHVAAVPALKARYGARVVGPMADAYRVPEIDEGVREGDKVRVGGLEAVVIDTPGHTVGHIAYYFAAEKLLFSGDTMFSLGCGRLFEGTPAQMWESLQKLAAVPDDTRVYCGHEYTLSNARFASGVDPTNPALKARVQEVEQLRAANAFTLPTMIGIEKATNPFLRAADPSIARQLGMEGASPVEVFAELRERKNRA